MTKIKYFIDTEFIEDGKTIDLISLGIACEDGRTLYLQNVDCNFQKASDWVWRNVFPHLIHFNMVGRRECLPQIEIRSSSLSASPYSVLTSACGENINGMSLCPWASRVEMRDRVLDFCSVEKYGRPEFWGYFADYDWVVFCQLFGAMIQLPKGFPMYCRDIKQWADQIGNIRIPKPEVEIHHALKDALWVRSAHEFLTKSSGLCPE